MVSSGVGQNRRENSARLLEADVLDIEAELPTDGQTKNPDKISTPSDQQLSSVITQVWPTCFPCLQPVVTAMRLARLHICLLLGLQLMASIPS